MNEKRQSDGIKQAGGQSKSMGIYWNSLKREWRLIFFLKKKGGGRGSEGDFMGILAFLKIQIYTNL